MSDLDEPIEDEIKEQEEEEGEKEEFVETVGSKVSGLLALEDDEAPPVEDNIIFTSPTSVLIHPKGLGYYLNKSLKKHQHKIGQVDVDINESDTFGEMLLRAEILTRDLKHRKITHKDVVCIYSKLHFNVAVAFLAVCFIGAKVAPLDNLMPSWDAADILFLLSPKIIFTEDEYEFIISNILEANSLEASIIRLDDSRHSSGSGYETDRKSITPYVVENLDEIAIILPSSGVHNAKKCCCISHKAALYYAGDWIHGPTLEYGNLSQYPSILTFLSSVVYGIPRILCRNFRPNEIWKFVDMYKVSFVYLTPFQCTLTFKKPPPRKLALEYLAIGGDALEHSILKYYQKICPRTNVFFFYGMAEIFCPFDITDAVVMKTGSIGRVKDGFTYKVMKFGAEISLPPLKSGELRIKSPYACQRYSKKMKSWDKDGFFKTNDIVFYDNDYCFYFVERTDNLIRGLKLQFQPKKLEYYIMQHHDVEYCTVIGLPKDGKDMPAAFIISRENSKLTEQILLSFIERTMNEKLRSKMKIIILDYLPLTSTWKINKRLLKLWYYKKIQLFRKLLEQ